MYHPSHGRLSACPVRLPSASPSPLLPIGSVHELPLVPW